MGLDFIRGKAKRDRRLRDRAFEDAVRKRDLFTDAVPKFAREVKARPSFPLDDGARLHGVIAEGVTPALAHGVENNVVHIPDSTAADLRNGDKGPVPVVAQVIATNARTKVTRLRVWRADEEGDEQHGG